MGHSLNKSYELVGYFEQCSACDAILDTPVLATGGFESFYVQLDYRTPSKRFEIRGLDPSVYGKIVRCAPVKVDPFNQLSVFLRFRKENVYGNLDDIRDRLMQIEEIAPIALQIQLRDILDGSTASSYDSSILEILPKGEFRYLSAALSVDALFRLTFSKMQPDQSKSVLMGFVKLALSAVHNWEIDRSKISNLAPFLEHTGLTIDQFQAVLTSRRSTQFESVENEEITTALRSIIRFKRQERRLARFLHLFISNPKLAEQVLTVYKSHNWLETLALSEMSQFVINHDKDEAYRINIVVDYIPRLMQLEYGAQRGKLLFDLASELGRIPELRIMLLQEFKSRAHTYTVGSWGPEICEALGQVS